MNILKRAKRLPMGVGHECCDAPLDRVEVAPPSRRGECATLAFKENKLAVMHHKAIQLERLFLARYSLVLQVAVNGRRQLSWPVDDNYLGRLRT